MAVMLGELPIRIEVTTAVGDNAPHTVATGEFGIQVAGNYAVASGEVNVQTIGIEMDDTSVRVKLAEALRGMADDLDPVGKHIAQSIEITEAGDVLVEGKSFPLYLTREPIIASIEPNGFTTVRLPIAVEHFVAATPTSPSDAPPPGADLTASQQ